MFPLRGRGVSASPMLPLHPSRAPPPCAPAYLAMLDKHELKYHGQNDQYSLSKYEHNTKIGLFTRGYVERRVRTTDIAAKI